MQIFSGKILGNIYIAQTKSNLLLTSFLEVNKLNETWSTPGTLSLNKCLFELLLLRTIVVSAIEPKLLMKMLQDTLTAGPVIDQAERGQRFKGQNRKLKKNLNNKNHPWYKHNLKKI